MFSKRRETWIKYGARWQMISISDIQPRRPNRRYSLGKTRSRALTSKKLNGA